jgi:hypothetical protein
MIDPRRGKEIKPPVDSAGAGKAVIYLATRCVCLYPRHKDELEPFSAVLERLMMCVRWLGLCGEYAGRAASPQDSRKTVPTPRASERTIVPCDLGARMEISVIGCCVPLLVLPDRASPRANPTLRRSLLGTGGGEPDGGPTHIGSSRMARSGYRIRKYDK